MKVETDIIASIAVCPVALGYMLVIMYVNTFKTDTIIFIGNLKMYLTSH